MNLGFEGGWRSVCATNELFQIRVGEWDSRPRSLATEAAVDGTLISNHGGKPFCQLIFSFNGQCSRSPV